MVRSQKSVFKRQELSKLRCVNGHHRAVNVKKNRHVGMLEKLLLKFEEDIHRSWWGNIWFQDNGAPHHTSRIVLSCLEDHFGGHVISLMAQTLWSAHSPDLTWGRILIYLRTQEICVRQSFAYAKTVFSAPACLRTTTFRLAYAKSLFFCVRKQIFGILTCPAYAKSHATKL